jgi:AcrR family transcriptional regulator
MPTELSADTRRRVLDVAWERVREHGPAALSVKDIAAAAGVSRQLVYFHYGSRAGLLTAMTRDRDGFAAEVAASRALEPREALERLLRAWCAHLSEILPVARALEAAAIAGDEGGEGWRGQIEELRAILGRAVERLPLRTGWTADTAADWIWSRVQPSAYAHLVLERGWTPNAFTYRTIGSLLAELVEPQEVDLGAGG